MKKSIITQSCYEFFEYHGSTEIERIRRSGGRIVKRDWLMFDSIAEAMEYFNTHCGERREKGVGVRLVRRTGIARDVKQSSL